jgi:hypothetical protein
MAEHFVRGRSRVTFSNGATQKLYGALVILGERSEAGRSGAGVAVLAWLRQELAEGSAGGRAFALDPPQAEVAEPARLRFLAMLVGELAHALAQPKPDPTLTDIAWTREQRLSWLARVELLHEMIADALPSAEGCAPLLLELDDATAAEVDAERMLHGYRHAMARGTTTEKLAHIDRTIALIAAAGATKRRAHTVFQLLSDKADILAKSGDRRQAARVLCEAVAHTDDPTLAQATLDYAKSLEQ